jgi:hypothetical protein
MYGEDKPEMQCAEFEARLAEALDGELSESGRSRFHAHRRTCSRCAPLYAEAELGRRWLEALKGEPVEPPARLVDNILRATSWAELPGGQPSRPWWQRLKEWPALAPVFQTVLQPRFAMSFAMVFFAIAAVLSITGVDLRHVRLAELQPSNLQQTLGRAQGRAKFYFDNIRWVYELESRVRDLKRETAPSDRQPQTEPTNQLQNRPGRFGEEKYRGYSKEQPPLLAEAFGARLAAGTPDWAMPEISGGNENRS